MPRRAISCYMVQVATQQSYIEQPNNSKKKPSQNSRGTKVEKRKSKKNFILNRKSQNTSETQSQQETNTQSNKTKTKTVSSTLAALNTTPTPRLSILSTTSPRRRLRPMPQHLPNRCIPLTRKRIRKLRHLLRRRHMATPHGWLRSLVARIVRYKLAKLHIRYFIIIKKRGTARGKEGKKEREG